MGRHPGYDAANVISRARNLFWRNGFDKVSVTDVERATGLSRSSVYHAFGSMRGLFDAAVLDYLETVVRPRLRGLTGDRVSPHALQDYLRDLGVAIEQRADSDEPTGCLLVGTAATSLGDDSAVREVIAAYHRELLDAVLAGARAADSSAPERVVEARARSVAGAVIAANVLARVDTESALALLEATARSAVVAPDAADVR